YCILLQKLGYQESKLQCLIRVEPRIAVRVISIVQVVCRNRPRAARAFRHILSRHLYMDAAWMRAFGAVHLEERLHLLQDAVEGPRLVTVERNRVTVHWVARPDH